MVVTTSFLNRYVCIALAAICALPQLANAMGSAYNTMFNGEGTYYGESSGGNCVLRNPVPSMYSNMVPVAMNGPQYENSDMCGACLRVVGDGDGSGSNPIKGEFMAFVADKCPECKYGDIDLAKSGDGRWKVRWELVRCPTSEPVSFYFEGSNPFYYKVQPRGLPSPATKMIIGGVTGQRSQDNFYVAQNGASFQSPVKMQVWTVLGDYYETSISGYSGTVYSAQSAGKTVASGYQNVESKPAPAPATSDNNQCTPDYHRCAGADGHPFVKYVGCCSSNFQCVESAEMGWGKQCRPKGY